MPRKKKQTHQKRLLDSTKEIQESTENLQKNTLKSDDYKKLKKAFSNFKLESVCKERIINGEKTKGVIQFDENPIFEKIIRLYDENQVFAKQIMDVINAPHKSSYYLTEFLIDFIGEVIDESELIIEKKKYVDQLILSPFYSLSVTSICSTYMDLIKENLDEPSEELLMRRLKCDDKSKVQKITNKLAFKHLLLESILEYLTYLSKAKSQIGGQNYIELASGNKYNLKVSESVDKVISLYNRFLKDWGICDIKKLEDDEMKEKLGFK